MSARPISGHPRPVAGRPAAPGGAARIRPLTFGRYELLGHLARGTQTDCFLARTAGPRSTRRLLALSLLRGDRAPDPPRLARLLTEWWTTAQLRPAAFLRPQAVGRCQGVLYAARELCLGAPLARVLLHAEERALTPAQAALLVGGVAAAVHTASQAARARGARLLLPELAAPKVFVAYDGEPRLLLCGAREVPGPDDPRTLLAALGRLLFECLTGPLAPSLRLDRVALDPRAFRPATPPALAELTVAAQLGRPPAASLGQLRQELLLHAPVGFGWRPLAAAVLPCSPGPPRERRELVEQARSADAPEVATLARLGARPAHGVLGVPAVHPRGV